MRLAAPVLAQRHRGSVVPTRGIQARYVRFLFRSTWNVITANDGYVEIPRIRFYADGVFLPYSGTEVATESSYFTLRPASRVFQNTPWGGDGNDVWDNATGASINGSWIAVDFGEVRAFEAFGIWGQDASNFNRAPGDFELQTSVNGTDWFTHRRYRGHDWRPGGNFQMFYTDNVPHQLYGRFWRAYITNNQGASSYGTVAELSMAAVPGGADQCSGGTASSSGAANSLNAAYMAFDDDPAQKWTADHQPVEANPTWVQYDFGAPVGVAEIRMQGCIAGQEGFAPKDVFFQVSDNGVAFRTAATYRNLPSWDGAEVRTFSTVLDYQADTFELDSGSEYTYLGDSVGSWVIAGGKVTWSGPLSGQSIMLRNGPVADGWVEVESNELSDGGLVTKVADSNNYLLDVFADNFYTRGYYRSTGTFNQVGNQDVSAQHVRLARGMNNMCRVELVGDKMYSWVNGWLEGAWAVPSYAAGKFGLRASNTPTSYNELRWKIVT